MLVYAHILAVKEIEWPMNLSHLKILCHLPYPNTLNLTDTVIEKKRELGMHLLMNSCHFTMFIQVFELFC